MRATCTAVSLFLIAFGAAASTARAATVLTPPNASFEDGDLTGWTSSGDVSVQTLAACLQPQMPSEGTHAACLSNESLFGGAAVGLVQSDLESPPVSVSFRPQSLTITFDFVFGTAELARSVGFDDQVTFTLLTGAGPFPLLVSGGWGTTTPGKGITLDGSPLLSTPNPGCPVSIQTGLVNVKWKRTFTLSEQLALQNAPIVLQVALADRGDDARLSFACIDNLTIKASKN
jgi:hypothetical protein